MAITAFYTIEDKKGLSSTISIPIPGATSPTNAKAFTQAMAPIVGALTNGRIINAGVTLVVDVTGFPATADALSDVQERGFFSFRTLNNFIKNLNIPCFKESLMVPNSKEIDQSDTDVAAFITAMENGVAVAAFGGTGTISPCDSRDDGVSAIIEARENWGKYRK